MDMRDGRPQLPKASPFKDTMTKRTRISLIISIFLFSVALPILLYFLSAKVSLSSLGEVELSLLSGAATLLGIFTIGYSYLKEHFESIRGNALLILRYIILAMLLKFALELIVQSIYFFLSIEIASTENNEAILELSRNNFKRMLGLTVIIAPIVEEVFFRGCLFGGLYKYGRALAYAVSVLGFSLLHVAGFMITDFSFSQIAQLILYVPASVALAYCYEKSGNIWASIAMHSGINALAMFVLNKLA